METATSRADFSYRAFISYSHADKLWADWLHKALENWRVPSRLVGKETTAGVIPWRLTPIFRDRDELASAHDLGRKVNAALAQSANLIVICSPRAAASRWVDAEVLAFKRLGRSERIFCLIVDGEPNASDLPGREVEECFAPALRFQLDANGQLADERSEPIAADARAGKDGRANAKLKLIAGMLDVGFDALKQRELQRRNRRMTAIAALALMVMAVTTVLAVVALISRHDAVIAQHKAVVAQQAAERRLKQAEGLVGFMLGDLNTRLRQVDRLDILQSVDDKAMEYFKSLPITDVDNTTLAQRAKALQKIGDVRMSQSRLSDAMDAFEQALRLNQHLVELSPRDPARHNAYGENLLWVGFNYWNQGKLDRAEDSFNQAADALQRAAALAPSDNDIQHNLDNVYNNLGNVAAARGELTSASAVFSKDLALDQHMAKVRPNDILWQQGLSYAYGNLGNIALARGLLDVAVANYLKQQQLMAEVVAQHPDNRQMHAQLMEDNGILARALAFAGRMQDGVAYARSAVKIGEAFSSSTPVITTG